MISKSPPGCTARRTTSGAKGAADAFFGPAPCCAPYGATLSLLSGTAANGTWNLYVQDDGSSGDSGTIAGGWSLTVVDPPLGTGFTYQGRLKLGGQPLNATVDLRFTLLDATGGAVGSPVEIDNVPLTEEGLFTVELNSNGEFGADAFDGEARLLEIAVANPAGSPFATLSPPQPVTGAPYATTAKSAFTLEAPGEGPQAVFVDEVGNVGIGTSEPQARLHIAGTPGTDGIKFPNGSLLTSAALVGEVRMWGGPIAAVPIGWVLCDGSEVSRTAYGLLFSVIGTIYGSGDGSTTFNLPDFRNRSPLGTTEDDGGIPKTNVSGTLTQMGGEATHILTVAEMPAHTHTFTGLVGNGNIDTGQGGFQPGQLVTDSTGGNQAHNNLHPYFAITFIIYAGQSN